MTKQEAEILGRVLAQVQHAGILVMPDDMAVLRKSKVFAAHFDRWTRTLQHDSKVHSVFYALIESEFGIDWRTNTKPIVEQDDLNRVWEKARNECAQVQKEEV